jgi:hypothetical protein
MKECDKRNSHISSKLYMICISSKNDRDDWVTFQQTMHYTEDFINPQYEKKLHEFYCSLKLLVLLNQTAYCGPYLFLGWKQKTNADKARHAFKIRSRLYI